MKLTMKEIKKKIKNNETIQFTIASYLKNVALNKKVYKRFVKAIAQRIKSFYPEFTTAQILDVLDRLKVLPEVSKFDDEGYFMHNGRKEYSSNSTFEIKGKTFNAISFNRNADYFELDSELGVKLVKLDQQLMLRQQYEAEMQKIRKQVIELNEVIAPTEKELTDKFSEKVIKTQKVVSSTIVRDSFREVSQKFNEFISKKLGLRMGYYSVELSSEIRWPQEGEYGGALYREYDGTMCVDQRLADKYIEKNYSKEIKSIKSEIEKLNKKMTVKSPIQFEISYGVAMSDKTSNIYSGITLKQLPQEIDAKYLKKMESLFKKNKD